MLIRKENKNRHPADRDLGAGEEKLKMSSSDKLMKICGKLKPRRWEAILVRGLFIGNEDYLLN